MGDSIKFNGGGDLDNGMTVSVYYELDGGTYDDYNLKLGMGDAGTLSFSGASSSEAVLTNLKILYQTLTLQFMKQQTLLTVV